MITSNRGMFLETIINKTIDFINNKNYGYFSKRHLPIKIFSYQNKMVRGWLKEKTETDYYGIYQGLYFDFEAKQTNTCYFLLNQLKTHQYNHLINIDRYKGNAFILVYFNQYDKFFILEIKYIKKFFKNLNLKKISIKYFKRYGFELIIIYPGFLNLLDYFENINKKRQTIEKQM